MLIFEKSRPGRGISALPKCDVDVYTLPEDDMRESDLHLPEMAEVEWWMSGMDTDYELIIGIRNEVAIAALSLNRNSLYHYNNEVFTRLYKLTSTDPTLENYCNDIKMANRNKTAVHLQSEAVHSAEQQRLHSNRTDVARCAASKPQRHQDGGHGRHDGASERLVGQEPVLLHRRCG